MFARPVVENSGEAVETGLDHGPVELVELSLKLDLEHGDAQERFGFHNCRKLLSTNHFSSPKLRCVKGIGSR